MMNRYLSLLVAVVAPVSAVIMLIAGAHPFGTVTLAERAPCIGLAILALTLAIVHMRLASTPSARAEAAMWCGLAIFLVVATFASPHLGPWGIVAALSLAATSVARIVASHGRSAELPPRPFRGRIVA
jgi:hypothetical protein